MKLQIRLLFALLLIFAGQTLAVAQTGQLTAGDLVPVAYRMNASGSSDQIALLCLVTIPPGTNIQVTDAKYTDNQPAQCAGGFTWQSPSSLLPAGTVLIFDTDAPSSNLGSVSGNGFGLSSNGDQVLLYQGSNDQATHITALSSKAWTTGALTTCSGSNSKLPAGLVEGESAISLSMAPGNTNENTVNAYYNGPQTGSTVELRQAILNPSNWVGAAGGTAPQVWPNYSFPGPPQVESVQLLGSSTLRVVFSDDLDSVSAVTAANYQGIPNLASVAVTNNGNLKDSVLLQYNPGFVAGTEYVLTIENVISKAGLAMVAPYVDTFSYSPVRVSFLDDVIYVNEGQTDAKVKIAILQAGMDATVQLAVSQAGTALDGIDYSLPIQSFNIQEGVLDTVELDLILPENSERTGGKYLVLDITPGPLTLTGSFPQQILLIVDNDIQAPAQQNNSLIQLRALSSIKPNPTGGSAEISAYDVTTKRLFVTNITKNTLDILNLSNPVAPTPISSIDMNQFGGGINSVATSNGLVAVALDGDTVGAKGSVFFFSTDGAFLSSVEVGYLPDMVTFTKDGLKAITANEGEPNSDYSFDPEGSVSVIDLSNGPANATVTTVGFESFNNQIDQLKAAGIRIFGPGSSVAQDFEPEYVCVSEDNQSVVVTLQENNAVAILDLNSLQFSSILPLGYKDHSLPNNLLDASDRGGKLFFAAWPIKGTYMPDAIECFEVGGITYAITANEGDAREYGNFVEPKRLKDITLDPSAFPFANVLKKDELLGRLNITTASGDTDGDGDFDEIYAFGARSITLWNLSTGQPVWDSGDQLETITAFDPIWGPAFNSSNSGSTSFKNRSDDKGPEPEAVIVADIEGKKYAFAGLERIGGIVVYDITSVNEPVFVQYINTRNLGDLGPEGLFFIPKAESPNGRNLLVLSNEVSGTITIFQIELDRTQSGEISLQTFDFNSQSPIVDVNGQTIFEGGISGLHYVPGSEQTFLAISDRGPNADAGSHPNATGTTLLFPAPEYAPKVTKFKAENGTWQIESVQPLLRPGGTPVSGLPLPANAGSTGETAWSDTTPIVLNPDIWGIDSEGIVEDNEGNLWICEEYGSSVWKLNPTTLEVIRRYTPFPTQAQDQALPSALGKRRPNRGFEGIAYTPNGKIITILQGPAYNPNAAAGNNSRLTRIVEIDPKTDSIRQFVYELNPTTGQIRTSDWKIGDLVAVNNEELLLIEHAERNGWNVKNVYKVSMTNATPLTTETFNGQTLEQVGNASNLAAFGITTASKTLVLDLLEAGWDRTHDKPEGLTILNDSTIALVNDNDFGIESPAANGSINLTGKSTRLYIYGLNQSLGFVSPYCDFQFPEENVAFCNNTSAIVDPGAGFTSYSWSNGSQSQSIETTQAGTYSVTVTNAVGCEATDSIQLTALALPDPGLVAPNPFCSGQSGSIIANAGFVNYHWNNGATGSSILVENAGTYSLQVTDSNGCTNVDSIQVVVWTLPIVDILVPTATCEGTPNTLTAVSDQANSYAWSNSSTTAENTILQAGNYTVTVTDQNGCTSTASANIGFNQPSQTALNLKVCPGASVTYNNTVLFGGEMKDFLFTNSFGCDSTVTVTVQEVALPPVDLGADTTLAAPISYVLNAGPGYSNYQWNTGATTSFVIINQAGTYSVTVSNSIGCTDTDEIVVQQASSTSEPSANLNLGVSPNPTSGTILVQLTGLQWDDYQLEVCNPAGKVLKVMKLGKIEHNYTHLVDISELPSGMYFLNVRSGSAFKTIRVVLQK